MTVKKNSVNTNSFATNGNAAGGKGNFVWAASTRAYELEREKIEFNLDVNVIKKLSEFVEYLVETNAESKKPHQSGIVEEFFIMAFKSDSNFQVWLKNRVKKIEEKAEGKSEEKTDSPAANQIGKDDNNILEGIGKIVPGNTSKVGAGVAAPAA